MSGSLAMLALSGCVGVSMRAGEPPAAGSRHPSEAPPSAFVPLVDHHQHVVSPTAAAHGSDSPLPPVALPPDLTRLLAQRAQSWDDPTRLVALLTDSATVLDEDGPVWTRGRGDASQYLATLFGREHRITPVAYGVHGDGAYIVGYYTRDVESGVRHFGHAHLSLARDADGTWRIAAETPRFPGVFTQSPRTAADVIADLDAAGIERAALLSAAYWLGSYRTRYGSDEYAKVRAENDWAAAEAARYPGRLVALCSVNPLRSYALAEIARCGAHPGLRGLKLHFGNSGVELSNPAHIALLRDVFSAANAHRLPVVAHMWTDPEYEERGGADARVLLERLLPAAADVPVQIAHMAGGGRSTDSALAVFAHAIAAGDPRTRQLYFDVATLNVGQSDEGLQRDAARMRQIGMDRILWGSDMPPSAPRARDAWMAFRIRMPLSDAELRILASNVAPYMR